MPAFDLAKRTATLGRFDVVGTHSDTSAGFVRHVALFNSEDREVSCGDTVSVAHMGPPLETDGQLEADVAGRIPLTNDEIKIIQTWIAKVKDESPPGKAGVTKQYIIDPPWEDICHETGVRRYRRYSCAGFVLDVHNQVGISLLIIDKDELPEVTRETLETAYPDHFRRSDRLKRLGLQGDGPWQVVLASYVIHALDRSGDEIRVEPYLAQSGDEFFPGRVPRTLL